MIKRNYLLAKKMQKKPINTVSEANKHIYHHAYWKAGEYKNETKLGVN